MLSPSARISVAALLCGLLSACGGSTTPDLRSNVSAVDSAFVTGATQSSNAEIAAANIALTKTQNPDLIAFANEMITQHTQEKTALAPIAASVGLGLPTGVNPTQAAAAARLKATAEPAFDALYTDAELQGHTLNLDDNYNPEVSSGTNPPVVAYANKYRPQIQTHLQMITAIKAKYGF